MIDHFQIAISLFHLAEDLARPVGRAVIDHDDLLANRDGADPSQDLVDRRLLFIDRDHDREDQVLRDSVIAQLAAERLAQLVDEPVPPGGIVGECPDRSGRTRGSIGQGGLRIGKWRADIHRAKIPKAPARPLGRLGLAGRRSVG